MRPRRVVPILIVAALFPALALPAGATEVDISEKQLAEARAETGGDIATNDLMAPLNSAEEGALRERLGFEVSADVTTKADALATADRQGISLTARDLTALKEARLSQNRTSSQLASSMAAATYPASYSLAITHAPQANGHYCGPATGVMILRQAGATKSAADGSSLTQARLATSGYMKTDQKGATRWADRDMVTALNKWAGIGGSTRYMYLQKGQPTVDQIKFAAKYRIGHNKMAFAGSTVEYMGGAHYNGHPDRLIGHWIVGYSYASGGAMIGWADPATSVYPNAKARFSATTTSFQKFLSTNGVAY